MSEKPTSKTTAPAEPLTNHKTKVQLDCNPSKCDEMSCYMVDLMRTCSQCKYKRPNCEFDEEADDGVCDSCRTPKADPLPAEVERCPECGHTHDGVGVAYICIGCPCPVQFGKPVEARSTPPRQGEQELSACPGCNKTDRVEVADVSYDDPSWMVMCRRCGWAAFGETKSEAIDAWNRPAPSIDAETLARAIEDARQEWNEIPYGPDKGALITFIATAFLDRYCITPKESLK